MTTISKTSASAAQKQASATGAPDLVAAVPPEQKPDKPAADPAPLPPAPPEIASGSKPSPKGLEGEIVASKRPTNNATKHGAYSRGKVVIAGEDEATYEAMLENYREELCPEGAAEEACVTEIVNAEWRKQTFEDQLSERQSRLRMTEHGKDAIAFSGNWRERKQFFEKLKVLDAQSDNPVLHRKDVSDDERHQQLRKLVPQAGGKDVIAEKFLPACKDLERYAVIVNLLDTRIDKAYRRLVALKEYKRMYIKPSVAG